ncbi:MAG TPA: phosphatase PAP2 family protein, partial [Bryobacteraceae bacterium]
ASIYGQSGSENNAPDTLASAGTASAAGEAIAPAAPVLAQPLDTRKIGRAAEVRLGFTTLVRDHALLWSSPFRARRSALKTVLPLLGATAAAFALDHHVAKGLPNTPDQVRYSKAVSVFGTDYSLAAASGVFLAAGAVTHNRHAVETGLLAVQALAHTESIAQMLKFAAGRERPDFGEDGPGRFWHRQQSFPSGHAMSTWAVATVISREYHQNRFIRYGIFAFPIVISAARLGGQRHFLSDVVAGGSIGYLVGGWIYDRHHDPALGGAPIHRRGWSVTPDVQYDPASRGVGVSLKLTR